MPWPRTPGFETVGNKRLHSNCRLCGLLLWLRGPMVQWLSDLTPLRPPPEGRQARLDHTPRPCAGTASVSVGLPRSAPAWGQGSKRGPGAGGRWALRRGRWLVSSAPAGQGPARVQGGRERVHLQMEGGAWPQGGGGLERRRQPASPTTWIPPSLHAGSDRPSLYPGSNPCYMLARTPFYTGSHLLIHWIQPPCILDPTPPFGLARHPLCLSRVVPCPAPISPSLLGHHQR